MTSDLSPLTFRLSPQAYDQPQKAQKAQNRPRHFNREGHEVTRRGEGKDERGKAENRETRSRIARDIFDHGWDQDGRQD